MNAHLAPSSWRRAIGALVAALLTQATSALHAADDAAATAARASLERVRAMRTERPGDGLLVYYQAVVHAMLGERDAALAELRTLVGRRLGIVPARGTGFDALWSDPEFQAVRERLAADEPRTADAPVAFRLNDARLLPEGIAFDPTGRRYFFGSLAQRKIVVSDGRGTVRDFSRPDDRLDTVLGLTVDARRHALFAVSTNGFEDSAKVERRNAVLRYDLKTGRLAARHDAPAAQQLNDVAVGPDGTLYATDSEAGTVFRLRPGESVLTPFGTPAGVRGANGIAASPDGALYVTLSTGIGRIDPRDGSMKRLEQPDSAVTGGIDGLYWYRGDLLGVQNTSNPGRVIRIRLDPAGQRVVGLTVLQSHHHPEFAEPTTAAIGDGALYVLANTHVGHYQPDGTIKDAEALRPTAVLAVPLDP
jgi:sugar lactone lactonase YvrE